MARRSRNARGLALAAVADLVGGELHGEAERRIHGVAEIDDAGPDDAAFCAGRRHAAGLNECRAGVLLLPPGLEPDLDDTRAVVRVQDPFLAVARLLEALYPLEAAVAGVHPTAVVGAGTELGDGVSVGPRASLGDGVRIGAGTEIGAGCSIAAGARIGASCLLYPNVSIYSGCRIGDRVILHAGVVIGADGFGFARADGEQVKVPQIGGVEIGSDVEVGANSCIDRGTFRPTRVGRGTKIDNLVQIGHNCQIGENCALSGMVGLSGSTVVEDGVIFGGNVGTAGHLVIGKGAMIAAKSGIHADVPAGFVGGGVPLMDIRTFRRVVGAIPKLPELIRRIRRLEHSRAVDED